MNCGNYINTSLVPVSTEIGWRRYEFRAAAQRLSDRDGGYPEWKITEIASSLETVFGAIIREGRNYDAAISELLAPFL